MTELNNIDLKLNKGYGSDAMLDERVREFRNDPERMQCANEFVDSIIEAAQQEVMTKDRNKLKNVQSSMDKSFVNGKAGLKQMQTRAKGMVSRMFQAICNCTKTGGPTNIFFSKSS